MSASAAAPARREAGLDEQLQAAIAPRFIAAMNRLRVCSQQPAAAIGRSRNGGHATSSTPAGAMGPQSPRPDGCPSLERCPCEHFAWRWNHARSDLERRAICFEAERELDALTRPNFERELIGADGRRHVVVFDSHTWPSAALEQIVCRAVGVESLELAIKLHVGDRKIIECIRWISDRERRFGGRPQH